MDKGQRGTRAVAVDLGGTRFRVAIATADGVVEWRASRFTHVERGVRAVLDSIFETVDEALAAVADRQTVGGIGVAAPGPLDPWTGIIYTPPNMPGWDRVPIKHLLEERFGLPTEVGNDANLAAVGEHRYGAGKGCRHIVYVTVSTGVGGGVIVDDQLLLGHGGYAGEVGHMTIDMRGPVCACGNVGCLETLASGTAIARRARELVESGTPTALGKLARRQITAQKVAELAYQGDEVARQLLRDAGATLGVGMVNLAHLFNPRRIILGGGVSLNAGTLWWDAVREVVRTRTMAPTQRDLEVVPAALGDDAGLLGAVAVTIGAVMSDE